MGRRDIGVRGSDRGREGEEGRTTALTKEGTSHVVAIGPCSLSPATWTRVRVQLQAGSS